MTDVVLIHPNGVHGIYGPLGDQLVSREQPLWPRLIAGYLLGHGVDVKIIDAECEGLSPGMTASLVAGYAPKLACIVVSGHQPSASTQAMPGARLVAEAINGERLTGTSVIMMGNHPSALPVKTLTEEPVDYVIDGEGPLTIMGLLNGDPLDQIPGLVWCDAEVLDPKRIVVQNPLAPLLDINDDLHGRAWHLLPPPSKYRSHNWQRFDDQSKRSPYAAIHTSLGCAFKCSFCMINVFQHTNRYRMRDPAAVVLEMIYLYDKYGVETFKFVDELFVLNKKHCRAICEGIIAAGLGDKINSWCYARTDTVDPDELKMFRAAGFRWFALGIESGSEAIRDGADKHLSSDEIKTIVHQIEAAGIHVGANYIFGLPGETPETMKTTLALAQELNTSWANFYSAMAYPGSKLYDEAVEKGWTLPATWAGYSQHNEFTLPLAAGTLTAQEILAARDASFDSYFTDPRYLDAITQRFGQGARQHIAEMTKYKLKRNLLEQTP